MTPLLKLNIGCGDFPLRDEAGGGWTNIDSDPAADADRCISVPPLPYDDATVTEIYCGHFLEHLPREVAPVFLRECYRVLVEGGKLGIVVPDTMAVLRNYVGRRPVEVECPPGEFWRMDNLEHVNALFLYGTSQPSHHCWSYDVVTLREVIEATGFVVTGSIDGMADPRIPCGAWWNLGLDAVKESAVAFG